VTPEISSGEIHRRLWVTTNKQYLVVVEVRYRRRRMTLTLDAQTYSSFVADLSDVECEPSGEITQIRATVK